MRPYRLTIAVFLFALAPVLRALEVPPPPTRWLTDAAGILSTTEAARLDSKLENFEQQSGAQFIIYTFPSLEGESVEDFTIRCVEKWKVGQKKYDNGLVLFVFVQEKKVRVEVGYGLEGTMTDAFSSRVIREYIAPHFQQGNYGQGLIAASDAIIAKIRGGEAPVPPLQPRGSSQTGAGSDISPFMIVVILFVVFFVVVPMLSRGGRRGGCGGCWLPMMFFPGGGSGVTFGGGGFSGGGFSGGGGGFSGGGGGFGGGGATGGW